MTDYMSSTTINDLIRSIFAMLDRVAYWLLSIMYQILFNVANADIFSNTLIQDFYGRVQLIIGIFMVFKLAVSIIQGIVNPDTFTDKKAGISSIITRIIFAIVLLTALTPFKIPNPKNQFEKEIADNGLLFGVLYDLQGRLLEQNTLGRLILGQNAATNNKNQQNSLAKDADSFSVTILKTFIRVNLKPGGTDESKESDWICKVDNNVRNAVKAYNDEKTDTAKILSLINASCEIDPNISNQHLNLLEKFKRLFGKDRYIFTYIPVISTIPAVILIYILLGEIITIAIRTVKLAVLRLLAPIPAISYIDPKSQKDGAFGAWVKNLTSTYLELFIHLAVLYFVIYLIQGIIKDGIVKNFGSGIVGALSFVFIIIGLFFFIKQAPKFIKDIIGVKGGGSNIGLATMLGGAAALSSGGGLTGALAASMNAADTQIQAANQGKQAPLGSAWTGGRDLAEQIKTGDPKAKGGMWNHANDYLMRQAGMNVARRGYGVTANGLAKAKSNMLNLNSEVSDLQDQYDRYTKGHMSADELRKFESENAQAINTNIAAGYNRNDAIRKAMYDKLSATQTKAAKAKSHYEDAKKFADSHRITPSFEEEHRRSLSERFRTRSKADPDNQRYATIREDYKAASRRRSAHQHISDRIMGSPDEWKDELGDKNKRVDNRWSPDKYSNNDQNAIADDSSIVTGVPGSGGGPGPGGPGHP